MVFEEETERLTCAQSGAVHIAMWHRMPVREAYRLKSQKCGETLQSGKGVRDYTRIELTT